MLRIGQFSDSFLPIVDGVGRVAFSYCETLGKKGHECYAIVPMTDMGYRARYPFEIVDFYSRPVPLMPQYRAGLPTLDPHYHARMDTLHFDIIHLHSPFIAGNEAIHYAKKMNVPLVGTFHSKYRDDFMQVTGQEFLAEIGVKRVVNVFNECDEVWAVSESSAETLRSYGFDKDIIIMPNGMDQRIIDETQKDRVKEKYKLKNDPALLFVGQMNWKKNILRILEACVLLHRDDVAFQLILAGQGPHEKEIREKIVALDLTDCVFMLGHIADQSELDGLYALSTLFVFPSLYDNAPMVLREAANAELASVVVGGSSASEVVFDHVNGLHCLDDSNDLYHVIKNGLSQIDQLKIMGVNARKSIPIAWDSVIDQVLIRYGDLVKRYHGK